MFRWSSLALLFALGACVAPPPAAPAATAQPAAAGQPAERYAVFFEIWSARLDEPARAAIAQAAARMKQQPSAIVSVVGFADPTGSHEANKLMSRTRAQVVTDALVEDGVPPGRIRQKSVGSVNYIADSIESRRVEIDIE